HMYASEYKIISNKQKKINEILYLDLNQYDIILIGCPGKEIPLTAHGKIRDYVSNGGWLITTDWALFYIIELVFPGYIRWNKIKTKGNKVVVACQILDPNHPFLDGVLSEIQHSKWTDKTIKTTKKSEFRWWLEIGSYPIQILNHSAVHVLIASQELKSKWGEAPVLVYFDYGEKGGRVIHMISHTHLQKGGAKGKYASALILTNILDEKVSCRMGISIEPTPRYVSNWETPQPQLPSQNQKTAPSQQNNYVTPNTERDGFGLSGTSQIIEADDNNFSFTSKCAYCGYDFADFSGKIYVCKECKGSYHASCLNLQMNKGVCRKCGRILLW
ncbi:MAG: PHD finger domain-containing protein, partial [Promethearchaeota archaeon]